MFVGDLIDLSTVISPKLAKTWYTLANWCYKWGRKSSDKIQLNFAQKSKSTVLTASETDKLFANEKNYTVLFEQLLPAHTTAEEKEFIVTVFSRGLSSIKLANVGFSGNKSLNEFNKEAFVVEAKSSLLETCKSLTVECIDSLLELWQSIINRVYYFQRVACKAYFNYLNLNSQVLLI